MPALNPADLETRGEPSMNFTGHSLLGLLAGAIAALFVAGVAPTTLDALPLPFLVPALVLVLVYLGAVYPDVDLRGSVPRQRVLPYLQALAVAGVVLAVALRWPWFVRVGTGVATGLDLPTDPVVAGAGAGLGAAVLAVLAVEPLLSLLTGPHRTLTHSVALSGVLAVLVGAGLWLLLPLAGEDRLVVAALPLSFPVGVAVHRLADDVG